jgi:rhodanese-related sulfurtransferase
MTMTTIDRDQTKRMLDEDAAILVEVLPPKEYESFHLPGAINVPLSDAFDRAIQEAVPDKHQPVVVYCKDAQCDASPRAARQMEALGYDRVYDYAAGKVDWKEAGYPVET